MWSMLAVGASLCMFFDYALADPKVVSVPISIKRNHTSLTKRDPFAASLQNFIPGNQYFLTITVGTPPQTIELLADTGSSDTWMYAPHACKGSKDHPCLGGSFDSSNSKSFQSITNMGKFSSRYGDGSTIKGDYFSDSFGIGGETVKHLTMGLVQSSKGVIASGIVGLGFDTNEAIQITQYPFYKNLPDELVAEGLISSKAFSLYLDDLGSATGSIIFGGYDTSQFSGSIKMLPIETSPVSGEKNTYTISLIGFGASFKGSTSLIGTNAPPYPVLLDSGTNLIRIPATLFEPYVDFFHLECKGGDSICFVDCNINKFHGEGTVDFFFGGKDGPRIAVPFSELAIPIYDGGTGQQISFRGRELCQFGMLPTAVNEPYILGQPFLRSAYVMYDLENGYVGVAQSVYDQDSTSNIKEYQSSGNMERIEFINSEEQAAQRGPAKTQVAVTTVHTTLKAPQPTQTPPSSESTGLTPQVTPSGGSSGGSSAATTISSQHTTFWSLAITACFGLGIAAVL